MRLSLSPPPPADLESICDCNQCNTATARNDVETRDIMSKKKGGGDIVRVYEIESGVGGGSTGRSDDAMAAPGAAEANGDSRASTATTVSETDPTRPVTPYHIIEILLQSNADGLPGIPRFRHVELLRRRRRSHSASSLESVDSHSAPATASASGGGPTRRKIGTLKKQKTTLALLTVEEEETTAATAVSSRKRKRSDEGAVPILEGPPPPYSDAVRAAGGSGGLTPDIGQMERGDLRTPGLHGHHDDHERDCCRSYWPWFLQQRPVLRLFLVITINGLVSMLCAFIFIALERPSQIERMDARSRLEARLSAEARNLTALLTRAPSEVDASASMVVAAFDAYDKDLVAVMNIPDEIEWEMLSASAFVTSVSSTTGYGDIVPVTLGGKLFTLIYALYGIPIFVWYIVKLGILFKIVVMRSISLFRKFLRNAWKKMQGPDYHVSSQLRQVFVTVSRPVQVAPAVTVNQEFQSDKRFHPMIIGCILMVFMFSVAGFISYMEGIAYFDAFYACFITYSTVGFGDIDIYRISYRSNWFNLMIYGNCVHIVGYMIVSAWVSAILTKCADRRRQILSNY